MHITFVIILLPLGQGYHCYVFTLHRRSNIPLVWSLSGLHNLGSHGPGMYLRNLRKSCDVWGEIGKLL